MLKSYLIKGKADGWYFRATETSNSAWLVEGSGVWGRKISIQGNDPEALLADAEKQGSRINRISNDT